MSHDLALDFDLNEAIQSEPIKPSIALRNVMWGCVVVGIFGFMGAMIWGYPSELLWGAYYTNVCFWMGLSAGGVAIAAIFQIVRAGWSPPVRRVVEANSAFLPWAFIFLMGTWFGKEHLFSWAKGPMPGREWWMQPDFVYARFAVLMFFLFYMMQRFVRMSLRSDIGFLRENPAAKSRWTGLIYKHLARNWKGSESEIAGLQQKLSWNAPLLIVLYVGIYSLFSFEMVMGMNAVWFSNLFGAFTFVGNIYIAWAVTSIVTVYLIKYSADYAKTVSTQQLWDLGKLTLGFCMLWGYMFFSQFLAQWYGNLPEETQWMILRTRIMPWKALGWITFSMCFVVPFILLFSEDLKKNPKTLSATSLIVFFGMWLERYIIVMPELSPDRIPFSLGECAVELSLFLGFLGVYVLSIQNFFRTYPFLPVSHPLTRGSKEW